MAFPLAIPVAVSAIQALIKFRGRLDTLLSLNETTKGLPFALPPAPTFDAPHIDAMVAFFRGAIGQNILVIRGLAREWRLVEPNPRLPEVQEERGRLMQAYYEAADVIPERLGPDEATNRALAAKGPSQELRLAYYVVESHRLARNPAVTRVLLAAADTLLEFGADHAGLFVADPRTRGLLETLLREFAVERDWDDASGEVIFKTLLGAAAVAALEHRGELPDQPWLQVLFDALGELQQDMGADFVARLVTREGFTRLVGRCLVGAAARPGLRTDTPALKEALAAMLRATGENLEGILGDPGCLVGVLEAGLAAAAGAAPDLIAARLGGQPLLAVVLKAAAQEFEKAGEQRVLFRKLASGEFFTVLYQACLGGLAANPDALASQARLKRHVAILIAACADELSKKRLVDALSADTVRALAIRGLEVLGRQPEFLAAHGEFAARVIGATLTAAADALQNGFTREDLLEITEAVVRAASTHLGLVEMDERLRGVLAALGLVLADAGLTKLTTGPGRKALFLAGWDAVAANPRVWTGFAERGLVEPLIGGVLRAWATDPSGLLSGPALVPAFRQTLLAAARRGRALLENQTTPKALEQMLTAALALANTELGASLDGETLPAFLQRVVLAFLAAPFAIGAAGVPVAWLREHLA
jgi:hypothetical protein